MDADTYERVLQALKRGHHGATKEAKQEHKDWHKVSRFLRQWPEVTVRRVHNPVSGALEERLVFPAQDSSVRIMIRTEEINQILENFYLETVGDGAAKLAKRIQKVFVGLNKINIQKWLNTKPSVQKTKPLFINCAPLIPVQASKVMERNQVDLVDMRNVGGKDSRFHYILSVIDVFSRYIFLKPLETKSSKEVASVLMRIYDEFGPPRILQSDRGTEFKGAVQELMSRLGVRVILSASYKPQSQGKVSR